MHFHFSISTLHFHLCIYLMQIIFGAHLIYLYMDIKAVTLRMNQRMWALILTKR